ncbi:MAG: ABC transporter permease [Sporomusaceae bacterium]|jgi:peptide/nickel transport system permease protein|nr:ABC transporter permease [Sporomusaceae bacterium]
MIGFIIRRILSSLPVLLVISMCAFFLINLAPGDPVAAMYGSKVENMRPEDHARIKENLGLNKPLGVQYLNWLNAVLTGDFGKSYLSGEDVSAIILERLPNTLILNFCSLSLMLVIAIVIGLISAVKQYSLFDYLSAFFAFAFYSVPSFWLALLAILIFSVYLGWFPSAGISSVGKESDLLNRLHHLVLPVLVLSLSHVGAYMRFVRSSLLEVLGQDYMLLAKAKGLYRKEVFFTHAFRNAIIPLITYVGMSFSSIIGGAYLVETVFAYPGLGQLTIYAAATRDYPLLMGAVLLTGVFVVTGNLIADILCAWADPRLKVEGVQKRIVSHG